MVGYPLHRWRGGHGCSREPEAAMTMPKPKQQRPKLIERRLWERQDGSPIGFLVWWSLGREIAIDHAQLRSMMTSVNLDPDLFMPHHDGPGVLIYTVSDIRKIITRGLSGYLGAVSLRSWNGGIYFVAEPYLAELQGFKAILSTIESTMFIAPIHEAGDLAYAVQDSLDAEMDDLVGQIAIHKNANARIDTWRNRKLIADDLVGRCLLYEESLQIDSLYVTKASSLRSQLEGIIVEHIRKQIDEQHGRD